MEDLEVCPKEMKDLEKCPECDAPLTHESGCVSCMFCGWSLCS